MISTNYIIITNTLVNSPLSHYLMDSNDQSCNVYWPYKGLIFRSFPFGFVKSFHIQGT